MSDMGSSTPRDFEFKLCTMAVGMSDGVGKINRRRRCNTNFIERAHLQDGEKSANGKGRL